SGDGVYAVRRLEPSSSVETENSTDDSLSFGNLSWFLDIAPWRAQHADRRLSALGTVSYQPAGSQRPAGLSPLQAPRANFGAEFAGRHRVARRANLVVCDDDSSCGRRLRHRPGAQWHVRYA